MAAQNAMTSASHVTASTSVARLCLGGLMLSLAASAEAFGFARLGCARNRAAALGSEARIARCNGSSRLPMATSPNTERIQIPTVDNVSAEVLYSVPRRGLFRSEPKPPLLFLHGSFHSSWCWTERFFPYFLERGYPVVALSWRGTSGTYAGDGVTKVKAGEHCQDLDCLLSQLPDILGPLYRNVRPVVISHSFGGIIVMKYLEGIAERPEDVFGGIVMMCSVPPSGNGKLTMRFLRRSIVQSWKITAGFALKRCIDDKALCRDLFFGGSPVARDDGSIDDFGVSDGDLERYQTYFRNDTAATIDLLDLAKALPSRKVDRNGRAPFVDYLPPCMVIGATDDYIVDREGNEETVRYLGLDSARYVESPHDVMLGGRWRNAAEEIRCFLDSLQHQDSQRS